MDDMYDAIMNQITKNNKIIETIRKSQNKVIKEAKEAPKRTVKKINKKAYSIIDEFFNLYTPILYKRHSRGSGLYDAYYINQNGLDINVDFDADYLPDDYHQSAEIIYHNVFVVGYHGGSAGTDKHAQVDTPYWRAPRPHEYTTKKGETKHNHGYWHWYTEAPQSFSPYFAIKEASEEIIEEYEDDFISFIDEEQKNINNSLD